jgi:hypothetical protein
VAVRCRVEIDLNHRAYPRIASVYFTEVIVSLGRVGQAWGTCGTRPDSIHEQHPRYGSLEERRADLLSWPVSWRTE